MKVLLHACCGPCSIMCIEALRQEGFEVTVYFANPNIHPVSEYFRRHEAMEQVADRMDVPVIWQDDAYNTPGWLAMVHELGIADNRDYARCRYCYESRLALTCATASLLGFDAFTTSLLYSRHQQHDMIRQVGEEVSTSGAYASDTGHNAAFLYRDFRPHWQAGIDRSKEWGLYRQNYCACVFSEYERFETKLGKLVKRFTGTGSKELSA